MDYEKIKAEWRGTGMYKVLTDVSYSGGEKTLHIDVADFFISRFKKEVGEVIEGKKFGSDSKMTYVSSEGNEYEDTSGAGELVRDVHNQALEDLLTTLTNNK